MSKRARPRPRSDPRLTPANAGRAASVAAPVFAGSIAPVEPRLWLLAVLLLAGLLLALHGGVLGWPFVSDDFVFLTASRHPAQLFTSFDVYSNYFRPISRELYFFVGQLLAGNHPLPYHLFNFVLLLTIIAMLVRLGDRLGGPRAGLLAGAIYTLLYSNRMLMAWVSCSQDLLAACFALAAAHSLLAGHRGRAAAWHLAALLSKESVAAYPLVHALWRFVDAPPGTPWRRRLGNAGRESAPLWAATLVWAVIVVSVRTVRHAWARGQNTPIADVTLSVGSLWEGMRSALLSYVALEQPWSTITRAACDLRAAWLSLATGLVAVLLLTALSRRFAVRGVTRGAPDPMLVLGGLWAFVGAVPVALAGHHFSAYYITFSGIGFSLWGGGAACKATADRLRCARRTFGTRTRCEPRGPVQRRAAGTRFGSVLRHDQAT